MSTPKAIREAASRAAEVTRSLRGEYGDMAAQTAVYALLVRRWDKTVEVAPLLDEVGADTLSRLELDLDCIDLQPAFRAYEIEGKDPCVYFYEDFLRAYDGQSARGRGVHYSPPEVVSCIVRGVDSILLDTFHSSLDNALVVDPCCGVGTFLRHIERQTEHRPRAFGIEMMPAASRIASCLVNAEIIHGDWLSTELIDPGDRILVILGNPPYSGHSSNPGKLAELMRDYSGGLRERNSKWLQDDYAKFIRMAQHQVQHAGRGVVAFITNHSYLTNPTFRTMRQSLARTFDRILLLDLQGNVKRLGSSDENIFPIQMGVAIAFMIKAGAVHPSTGSGCCVRYAGITGSRREKLQALTKIDLSEAPWTRPRLTAPFYVFVPRDEDLSAEFYSFASLLDIFRESTVGFVTSRDAFAIGFTRDEVIERIGSLRDGTCPGIGDLDVERARRELQADCHWEQKVVEVLYRPFDRRWTYYSSLVMERPRLPFMQNLMMDNVALAIGRAGYATGSDEWDVVFCTDRPADLNLFRRGGAKLFPRYIYRGIQRLSNIGAEFADPDTLFTYIYAILHSSIYRRRYHDLLQVDYPRIPIARDRSVFELLGKLGNDLLNVHLMRSFELPTASGEEIETPAGLRIGGYEIPEKCLKDRAGVDDEEEVAFVKTAVANTLVMREQIDEVIAQEPPWA